MVTPQMKGIGVNDRFGNTSIRKQQGTSREIFDSILVTQAERQQGCQQGGVGQKISAISSIPPSSQSATR
ncbi:hypothetical protein CMK13_14130, partial [Candidatus Poribacteria bacterium]|nr:hypothetical protein [Candidatus Poribacteria bacterium]